MTFDRYGRKLKRRRTWKALPLLWIGAAVVGAAIAAPTCSKFIPTTTVTKVKNRVSKTTADAWAKWRIAHPNWKPNPKVVRPKYKMTTQEAVAKVEFACQATILDVTPPEIQLDTVSPPTIELALTPVEPPPVTPDVVTDTTPDTPPDTPLTPVLFTALSSPPTLIPSSPLAPTPEPGSLWLMGTGLLFVAAGVQYQKRKV
jgi:hypothetical protein